MELLVLAGLFGGATWLFGWWALAVGAALWALIRRRAPWRAGVAAALGWAGLLGFTLPPAPLYRLAPRIGGLFGAPGWAALLLTLVYAWLLGWSAARVVRGFSTSPPSSQRSPAHRRAPAR